MTTDPLAELLPSLERRGEIPLAWVVAYAPDGDLGPVWRASEDAGTLLRLMGRLAERRVLVRAACACARAALGFVPDQEPRPRHAIESAEAWARHAAALDAVESASDAAARAAAAFDRAAEPAASDAADAAMSAARVAAASARHNEAGQRAGSAARYAAAAHGEARAPAVLRELAAVVRAYHACPSLDALRAAYRGD